MTCILIIDDHPLYRSALRLALEPAFDDVEIIEASSIDGLDRSNGKLRAVDLILLDLSLPGVNGLLALLLLRRQYPAVPVAIVSAVDDVPVIRRALACGASGYITKKQPLNVVREAVGAIMDGEIWTPENVPSGDLASDTDIHHGFTELSPSEVRVLSLLCEGHVNAKMAETLNIGEATVKAHVSAVLQKLGVSNRTHAVIMANQLTAREDVIGAL